MIKYKFVNLDILNLDILNGGANDFTKNILSIKIVKIFEPLAKYYNISRKSRGLDKPTKSDKGFLQLYKELNGNWNKMKDLPVKSKKIDGEKWDHHRSGGKMCIKVY